jgi:hypothetical protein
MATVSKTNAAPRATDEDEPQAASLLGNVNLSDPQVRALRIAVIVMGVLIVMGLVAVIGRIIYLMARPSGQITSHSGRLTPEIAAPLPAGAHIKSVTLQGDRLAIHYEAAAGAGIVVIDLASGKTLSRVRAVPEAPGQ